MHLTTFTDYSLRVLIYLKLNEHQLSKVAEISDYFQISNNHLVKIVNQLGKHGLITTTRGKGGGIRLAEKAETMPMGQLVKLLEPQKDLVNCVSKSGVLCTVSPMCKLTSALDEALEAFYQELNRYTLLDIIIRQDNSLVTAKLPT